MAQHSKSFKQEVERKMMVCSHGRVSLACPAGCGLFKAVVEDIMAILGKW